MIKPTKLLIIGSDGFLGHSLLTRLTSDKSFIVYGTSRKESSKYFLDLNHSCSINFMEFDVVILLAGMTSPKDCLEQPELLYRTNVLSTISFIDICVRSGCFVTFLSTNSVFSGKESFCSIYDLVEPRSKYGEFKVNVESWVDKNYPNSVSILRLTKILPDNLLPPFVKRWIHEIDLYGFTEVCVNHYLSPITEDQVFYSLKLLSYSKQAGLFHCGGLDELSYSDYAKSAFKYNPSILNRLKFVMQGESMLFNSLRTFLPL